MDMAAMAPNEAQRPNEYPAPTMNSSAPQAPNAMPASQREGHPSFRRSVQLSVRVVVKMYKANSFFLSIGREPVEASQYLYPKIFPQLVGRVLLSLGTAVEVKTQKWNFNVPTRLETFDR